MLTGSTKCQPNGPVRHWTVTSEHRSEQFKQSSSLRWWGVHVVREPSGYSFNINIILPSTLKSPQRFLTSRVFRTKFCAHLSLPPCVLHVPVQITNILIMIFGIITVVRTSMLVSWVVTLRGLVGRYQRFGGKYCLHLQGWSSMFLRNTGVYINSTGWWDPDYQHWHILCVILLHSPLLPSFKYK
jgi:hypothetical protein